MDVRIAIDVVAKALADEYDVEIIASCDTDLAPVVELLHELKAKKVVHHVTHRFEVRMSYLSITWLYTDIGIDRPVSSGAAPKPAKGPRIA